jgi:hypothetical protein
MRSYDISIGRELEAKYITMGRELGAMIYQ